MIAADHGNDPTYRGTDHTREFIPLLAYSPAQNRRARRISASREFFADVGATVVEALIGLEAARRRDLDRKLAGSAFSAAIVANV